MSPVQVTADHVVWLFPSSRRKAGPGCAHGGRAGGRAVSSASCSSCGFPRQPWQGAAGLASSTLLGQAAVALGHSLGMDLPQRKGWRGLALSIPPVLHLLGPAFCASKSPTPVPSWGVESAKRSHKIRISWIGRESQGSSSSREVLITGQQHLICSSSTHR